MSGCGLRRGYVFGANFTFRSPGVVCMYWDPGCNLIGFSARSFGASGKNLLKHYTIRDHFLTLKTSCQALLLIVNSYQSSLLECRGGEGLYLYIDISYQHQYSNHMHTGTEFFMCTLMHKLYTVIYNHMEGHTVRHACKHNTSHTLSSHHHHAFMHCLYFLTEVLSTSVTEQ